jgi:hypothetical protein
MEVNNFIQTQLVPLAIVSSFEDEERTIILSESALLHCGEWMMAEESILIPNLMAVDIGIGMDFAKMTDEDVKNNVVISIISKIPESFYNSQPTVVLTQELTRIIRNQITTFFDDTNLSVRLHDKSYDIQATLKVAPWDFRIRHGISIRPMVDNDYNMTFEVCCDV